MLEAYRSCSWREKRDVLKVFWRGKPSPDETLNTAAIEYGCFAIILVAAIGLELLPIYIVSISRGYLPGELAIASEIIVTWALVRSIRSYRLLRRSEPTSEILDGSSFKSARRLR